MAHRMLWLVASVCALLFGCGRSAPPSAGPDAEGIPTREEILAGTESPYWKAFAQLPDGIRLTSAKLIQNFAEVHREREIPPEARAAIEACGPVIELLIAATRAERSVIERGTPAEEYHLAEFRAMARLFVLDAQLCISRGDHDAAAARFAALHRAAMHLRGDRRQISSLQAMTIAQFAVGHGEIMLNLEALSPAAHEELIVAAELLLSEDPLLRSDRAEETTYALRAWVDKLRNADGR